MNSVAPDTALANANHFRSRGIIQQYGALLVRLGVVVDSAVIYATLRILAHVIGPGWNERYFAIAVLGIFAFATLASFFNLYRSWRLLSLREELAQTLLRWSAAVVMVTVALFFLTDAQDGPTRHILLYWYAGAFVIMTVWRVVMRLSLRFCRAFGHDHRNVAFIGATETAGRLAKTFQTNRWMGIDIVGCYEDRPDFAARSPAPTGVRLAGSLDDLMDLTNKGRVDAVYITLPMSAEGDIMKIIDRFSDSTVSIHYCPNLDRFDPLNARWDDVFGQPVISVVASPLGGSERHLKRLEDLLLVALILPVILIPMLVIAIAVKLTSAGPVFYCQNRHGFNRRVFKIWKFRTMYVTEDDAEFVQAKPGDARVTPLGALLRRSSLDELPQILNVLKGEMSVVGPRPHPTVLNETHRKLIYRYMLRHKVKPGITGWAQVNGHRGGTETLEKMEKRIEYDLDYVRNWSVSFDLKVLALTLVRAFAGRNAY